MKHRASMKLIVTLSVALLAVLAFGSVRAQAWVLNGKGFEGESTFISSGSFEIEIPGITPKPIVKCSETGYGRIFENTKLEWHTSLSGCKLTSGGACEFKPLTWTVATWKGEKTWFHKPPEGPVEENHTAGYPTNHQLSALEGNLYCGIYSGITLPISDPDLDLEWYEPPSQYMCAGGGLGFSYGAEGVKLSVSTLTCPLQSAGNYMFIRGSSTWQLSGAQVGQKFGNGMGPVPTITSLDPTEVSNTGATLNGIINPEARKTTYRFRYGTDAATEQAVPSAPVEIGNGTKDVAVSQKITGLEPNTVYYFQIEATNASGLSFTKAKSFNTGTHEWGLQSTPEPAGAAGSRLTSVSCLAVYETCAAVGFYWSSSGTKAMTKVQISYKQWTLTPTAIPSGALHSPLNDVSCTSPLACVAVGYASNSTGGSHTPLAEHWSGVAWGTKPVPAPSGSIYAGLYGVDCTTYKDCIAVGYYEPEGSVRLTLAEHWNGTSWSLMSTPNVAGATTNELVKVSCASASDCWAVGITNKSGAALAEHWNGTSWSINSPTSMSSYLKDISCSSASSCVATVNKSLNLARWNGSTWSQETAVTPPGAIKNTSMLSGVSCTSASACVVTGRFRNASGVTRELAEGWDGSKWSVQSTSAPLSVEEAKEGGPEADLSGGVSCISATACTSVGFYRPTWASEGLSLVEVRH